ncbi:MAG: TlpA family protein disulfide reductase [Halobacteriaceae archaeon]
MSLSTFEPDPAWDPAAFAETVAAFESLPDDAQIYVWGGDWCGDCRRELPAVAAALEAADVSSDQVTVYPVTEEKTGDHMGDYDVTVIPTVVVEVDGEIVARFEESAPVPAPVALGEALADSPEL